MNKLRPCPFCGGEARVMDDSPFWVYCNRCGAHTLDGPGEDESMDAWNRREIYNKLSTAVNEDARNLCEEEKTENDLISREEAIAALKEHRALYCDNTPDTFSKLSFAEKSRVDELDTAIATLVNLPSANQCIPDCRKKEEVQE